MTQLVRLPLQSVELVPTAPAPTDHEIALKLASEVSQWFVRRDSKFYALSNLGSALSKPDIQRVCIHRLRETHPNLTLTNALLKRVFELAIDARTSSREHSIAVWSGKCVCRPGDERRLVWNDGLISVNTWTKPAYRTIVANADPGAAEQFFATLFPRENERETFLNWLAWCLQNEAEKPSWAPFLYSRTKGSGKSTLCQLVVKLFGEANSITQNSVDKLTSRFNMTLLQSKLVVSEELNLRPDSAQGNTLKTYITETATLSEQKGVEAERVRQSCCFLFTSNHLPMWIEAEDRRYYVLEIDHDGHASGPKAAEFSSLVSDIHLFMNDTLSLAHLYRFLMERTLPESFNAKSLNLATDSTDIMRRIHGASRLTSLEQLEELLNDRGANAISETEVIQLMADAFRGTINTTKHLMTELGWSKVKVKWGGIDYARALWLRDGFHVTNGTLIGPDGAKVGLKDHLNRVQQRYTGFSGL